MGHDHPEEEQPFFIHTYSDVQYIFIVQITYALIHICSRYPHGHSSPQTIAP